MDEVAAAVSDLTRRHILELLAQGPETAGALARQFSLSRPAVSRHLRVLRESGLVEVRVRGRERIYSLQFTPLQNLVNWATGIMPAPEIVPNLDALATEVHRAARDRRLREGNQEEIA